MTTFRKPRDAGLTLIELVAAMAIFATIAVMGLQSIGVAVRQQERLAAVDHASQSLGNALGQIRGDLDAAMPLLFYPPGQTPQSALSLSPDGQTLGISIGGQATWPSHPDLRRTHRAMWHLDPQTEVLSRQTWQALIPADPSTRTPKVTLLQGVLDMHVRSYWVGEGWRDGLTARRPTRLTGEVKSDGDDGGRTSPEVYSSNLPAAIELTLTTRDYGTLSIVQSFQ